MNVGDGVAGLLGIAAQIIRADPDIPSIWIYPALAVTALLGQLVFGADVKGSPEFWQHVAASFIFGCGMNRVTSDMAHGTPLETQDKEK